MDTTTPAIPGLSHRVRVENHDLGHPVEGATWDPDRDVATFDYLRVSGDTIEDALTKVTDHHANKYSADPHTLGVYHLGFNIDDRPVPSLQTLVSFAERYRGGYEWEVGFYGATETTRWRTNSDGQGLWRWTGTDWRQTHGHLQWSLPGGVDEAREWLCRRWGLTERDVIDDADLLTSDQVLARLAEMGRPIGAHTLRNYTSRAGTAPAGWPQPVGRVGRTPRWSRRAIEAYAAAR